MYEILSWSSFGKRKFSCRNFLMSMCCPGFSLWPRPSLWTHARCWRRTMIVDERRLEVLMAPDHELKIALSHREVFARCLMMLDELLCEVRELFNNVLQYEMIWMNMRGHLRVTSMMTDDRWSKKQWWSARVTREICWWRLRYVDEVDESKKKRAKFARYDDDVW